MSQDKALYKSTVLLHNIVDDKSKKYDKTCSIRNPDYANSK